MIVVADTTPLNYLVLIGHVELLPALYSRVLIPEAVWLELQRPGTPSEVRDWAIDPPSWMEVRPVSLVQAPTFNDLDAGEREAIQLALDLGIETVLMDESDGRRIALLNHLKVTGTVAIIEKAAQLGLVDFRSTLSKLEQTNFRLSASVTRISLQAPSQRTDNPSRANLLPAVDRLNPQKLRRLPQLFLDPQ